MSLYVARVTASGPSWRSLSLSRWIARTPLGYLSALQVTPGKTACESHSIPQKELPAAWLGHFAAPVPEQAGSYAYFSSRFTLPRSSSLDAQRHLTPSGRTSRRLRLPRRQPFEEPTIAPQRSSETLCRKRQDPPRSADDLAPQTGHSRFSLRRARCRGRSAGRPVKEDTTIRISSISNLVTGAADQVAPLEVGIFGSSFDTGTEDIDNALDAANAHPGRHRRLSSRRSPHPKRVSKDTAA